MSIICLIVIIDLNLVWSGFYQKKKLSLELVQVTTNFGVHVEIMMSQASALIGSVKMTY